MVDDFSLRGKIVKLYIKRRRWTDIKTGNIIPRDWNLIAKGTHMIHDFAASRNITNHYRDILNYFETESTNAAAESFNQIHVKLKNQDFKSNP